MSERATAKHSGTAPSSARREFVSSRVSSLMGVVPLAWLWIGHLWSGSALLGGVQAFDAAVAREMGAWPHPSYLLFADLLFLWIPLAYHAYVGISRFTRGRDNVKSYPTFRNWTYSALRWTGVILLPFLLFHLWHTWLLVHWKWGGQLVGPHPEHAEQLITFGGYLVWLFQSSFLVKIVYVVGLFAAALHLAQGLWTAGVNWGVVSGARAMQAWSVVCAGVFALVFVLSMNIVTELVRLGQLATGGVG